MRSTTCTTRGTWDKCSASIIFTIKSVHLAMVYFSVLVIVSLSWYPKTMRTLVTVSKYPYFWYYLTYYAWILCFITCSFGISAWYCHNFYRIKRLISVISDGPEENLFFLHTCTFVFEKQGKVSALQFLFVLFYDTNDLKNKPNCGFLFLLTVNLIAFTFNFKESVKNQ